MNRLMTPRAMVLGFVAEARHRGKQVLQTSTTNRAPGEHSVVRPLVGQ